jgi:putative FmdB family regulatory protein
MPIYEYACRSCAHRFEALVRGAATPHACEKCGSADIEKLLSLPTVKSESTHKLAMASARKRDARQATEKSDAQRRYEASHD